MSTASSIFETASSRANVAEQGVFFPKVPQTVSELGISQNILVDLMLKLAMLEGSTNLGRIARVMRISGGVAAQVFAHLRNEQFIEIKGMVGNDYSFSLSAQGRKIAQDRYSISAYVGPAPVALDDYIDAVKRQVTRHRVSRLRLKELFHDIVLTDETLDQLGPAVVSNEQIFLYGSTGNGKTSIAERLVRIFEEGVFIPSAIEVEGQIINLYDSVVHRPLDPPGEADARWVYCERPCIAVGGELVPEMLELRFEDNLGYYNAPLQMKANNGIFIVDDFGRQMINPRDLLNRWIVPLDRRVDFLSLRTGVKFPIPFETMVVFSTNLDPRQLADEAFLRRIQNKIKIDTISEEVFDEILRRICRKSGVEWTLEASAYVREKCREGSRKAVLRACYPKDVVDIVKNIADYEGRAPRLDKTDIDRAILNYFAR